MIKKDDKILIIEALNQEYNKRLEVYKLYTKNADWSNPTEGNQECSGELKGFGFAIDFLEEFLKEEC